MKVMTNDEIVRVLNEVKDGVLAMCDSGRPYCLPFGFVFVHDAVHLSLFPTGRKWDILQHNPHVCFNVFCWDMGHTEWFSVVIEGAIEPVEDMQGIEAVVRANIEKTGLDPAKYFEKRMEYYRRTRDNPLGLKIIRIKTRSITGRKMHTLVGS